MKKDFEIHYKSKAALNSPPHITLNMPFKLKPQKEINLLENLANTAREVAPFAIKLNDFDHFSEKVVYVRVLPNTSLLELHRGLAKMMRQSFQVFNADYKNRGYHPHMTIAFRNLNKTNFLNAWPVYAQKKYEREFTTSELPLLKHNGKTWDIYQRLAFKNATP